jgi:hypothetical protein
LNHKVAEVWGNLLRSPNWQRPAPEFEASIMGSAAALCVEHGLEVEYGAPLD